MNDTIQLPCINKFRFGNTSMYQVIWRDCHNSINSKSFVSFSLAKKLFEKLIAEGEYYTLYDQYFEYEVIGNVFENSDLLKK